MYIFGQGHFREQQPSATCGGIRQLVYIDPDVSLTVSLKKSPLLNVDVNASQHCVSQGKQRVVKHNYGHNARAKSAVGKNSSKEILMAVLPMIPKKMLAVRIQVG